MFKKVLILLSFVLISLNIISQDNSSYYHSPYLFNPYLINPAIAGSIDYSILDLSIQQISEKITGSPKTQQISYHTRLKNKKKNKFTRIGIGGYIYNDVFGPLKKTGIQLTYAYHIPLDKTYIRHLSLGVSFIGYSYLVNYGYRNIIWDPIIDGSIQRTFIPDANFGIYYYGKQLFGGISITQILETPITWPGNQLLKVPVNRSYFAYIGFKFLVNDIVRIEPSILYRYQDSNIFYNDNNMFKNQIDGNLKVYYKSLLMGLSYRYQQSVVILGQYEYHNIFFGLAYEYPMNNIWNYTFGTYNVRIGIYLGRNKIIY